MIDVISVEYKNLKKLNDAQYILYSQDIPFDIDNLKMIMKNASLRPKFGQSELTFEDTANTYNSVERSGVTVYLVPDYVNFDYKGMQDFVKRLKQFCSSDIVLQNNGIEIRPSFNAIDKHNLKDINGDIISLGNFSYHFGDFMQGDMFQSFTKLISSKHPRIFKLLASAYAPVLRRTNFEKIIGYANVNELMTRFRMGSLVENISPMSGSKYSIMMNDYPVEIKLSKIVDGTLYFDMQFNGKFEDSRNLPTIDPYILLFSRQPKLFPTIPLVEKVKAGNSITNVRVYIGVLNFPKDNIINNMNYSYNLLSELD